MGRTKVLGEKPVPLPLSPSTNLSWTDPELNLDLHSDKLAANILSHSAVLQRCESVQTSLRHICSSSAKNNHSVLCGEIMHIDSLMVPNT